MKVRVLVLNYNGEPLLKRYLPSLVSAVKRSSHECSLSVVDNASTDSSRQTAAQMGVGWVPMNKNRVLCAYNEAAKQFDEDVLIFMNNDIEVEEDFIDPLIAPFQKDPDVFFVTMRCLSLGDKRYEGNKTRARVRYGVFWSSAVYPGHEKDVDKPGPTAHGGFGAFDRKKFLELGGYDDLYLPGRLEDADICLRARRKGWRCLYEPASVVYHEGGVSFHKRFGVRQTLVINWRNTYLFMVKNFSGGQLVVFFVFWLPARMAYSTLTWKPEQIVGFFRAVPLLGRAWQRRGMMKPRSGSWSFWNRAGAGESYDRDFEGQIGRYVNDSETKPFRELIGSMRGLKVLDVGCGTGRYLQLFNPGNELNGLDISDQMLSVARQKLPNAKFHIGSADSLPFPDDAFDLVISVRVIQHLSDQEKMVREMVRVCRPNGRVILLSYNSWSLLCLYKQIRMSWIGRLLNLPFKPLLGRRSFFNPWGFVYDNYCSIPELRRWMRRQGLRIENCLGVTLGHPWFWNDFLIGKVMERYAPFLLHLLLTFSRFLDRTIARHFPFKYFADKNIVVGVKQA